MSDSLKDKALKGSIWGAMERFWVHGVQFLVMLVVARILSPKDYGLVGMLGILIIVSQTLVDSGFGQALIRKKDRDDVDCSTIFFFNIVLGVFFYLILYFIAPMVASFYEQPLLQPILRVFGLVIILNSFTIVQGALLTANLQFKKMSMAPMAASITSGIAAIVMAVRGWGVWTLVYQQIIYGIVNLCVLWFYSPWRPQWVYSWKSFREMFAFGANLMISGLIDTIYRNLYTLVIGKIFNAQKLGFYTRAVHYAQLPAHNINSIVMRVTYPILCKMQDNDDRLRENYRKLLKVTAFVIFPIMCGLAGASYPSIVLLIGKKWEFSTVLLVPICFMMMWYPIHAINLNLLKVKGRSDLFLRLEIIKKFFGVIILVASIPFGLVFMCYAQIAHSLISLAINTYYTGKLINLGYLPHPVDFLGVVCSHQGVESWDRQLSVTIDSRCCCWCHFLCWCCLFFPF